MTSAAPAWLQRIEACDHAPSPVFAWARMQPDLATAWTACARADHLVRLATWFGADHDALLEAVAGCLAEVSGHLPPGLPPVDRVLALVHGIGSARAPDDHRSDLRIAGLACLAPVPEEMAPDLHRRTALARLSQAAHRLSRAAFPADAHELVEAVRSAILALVLVLPGGPAAHDRAHRRFTELIRTRIPALPDGRDLDPWREALVRWDAPDEARAWLDRQVSVRQAWAECWHGGWMLAVLCHCGAPAKRLLRAASDIALAAWGDLPADATAARGALEVVDRWLAGEATIADLEQAAAACETLARERPAVASCALALGWLARSALVAATSPLYRPALARALGLMVAVWSSSLRAPAGPRRAAARVREWFPSPPSPPVGH